MTAEAIGIEALNVYCGLASIPVRVLLDGRGLDTRRIGNLMMDHRSVQLPFEDPVTNAVNAAKPLLEALGPADRDRIELLVTSTESGIDYSKSVASYVHDHLQLSPHCRVLEVKQACYGATAMVQLASGYLASGATLKGKALIIATDINVIDASNGYAEPATGHGAAAVLISNRPTILALDQEAFGTYSFHTMDTARPTPTLDLWDADLSLLTYLDCLVHSYQRYATRAGAAVDFVTSFDYLAFHTPFAGLVKAAHRTMMRKFAPRPPREIIDDFTRRVLPSLAYPRVVGNMFSGSVYLALCSVIDALPENGNARIGMYSYGSGCASEFFSGRIQPGARQALAAMNIANRLRGRRELSFPEYSGLLELTHDCLVPVSDRKVDRAEWAGFLAPIQDREPVLGLSEVTKFQRKYTWL